MHGLIHLEFERYATSILGADAWASITAGAKLAGRVYLPTRSYDDAEIVSLVIATAAACGTGPQALLEDFGDALVPALLGTYGYLLHPHWRTLDLIENTEQLIHTALREADPAAHPPPLATRRRGPTELVVVYSSPRQMCGLARGIIRGVARHFGERVQIEQEACMLAGDEACEIAVTVGRRRPPSGRRQR
jgi:hypothetical protein